MRPGPDTSRMDTVTFEPCDSASAPTRVVEKPSQGRFFSCACGRIHISSGGSGKLSRAPSGSVFLAASGTAKMKLPDSRLAWLWGSESSISIAPIDDPSAANAISICPASMSLRRSSAAAEPVLVGVGAVVGAVVDVGCDVVDDVGRGAGFGDGFALVVGLAVVVSSVVLGVRRSVVVPSGRPTVVSSPTSQYWVTGSERSTPPPLSSARPCQVIS